jgi:hypothetical protein
MRTMGGYRGLRWGGEKGQAGDNSGSLNQYAKVAARPAARARLPVTNVPRRLLNPQSRGVPTLTLAAWAPDKCVPAEPWEASRPGARLRRPERAGSQRRARHKLVERPAKPGRGRGQERAPGPRDGSRAERCRRRGAARRRWRGASRARTRLPHPTPPRPGKPEERPVRGEASATHRPPTPGHRS